MASFVTRAERSGNIFFRVTGLIRSGQLPWAERPLWYDVYAASPPLSPPDWNVKLPKHGEPVRKIFYEEDLLRAKFYKKYKGRREGIVNVTNEKKSTCQLFIEEYNLIKSEGKGLSDDEIFNQVEQRLDLHKEKESSTATAAAAAEGAQ